MKKIKAVAVYCSSSQHIDTIYKLGAKAIGEGLAQKGLRLIYGGGGVGLMGIVARGALDNGGAVTGIIPKFLEGYELGLKGLDEYVVTETMRERKAEMEKRADAFLVLPGGFGTLEEITEVLTAKQLQQHQKPIVFVNIDGFWDVFLNFIDVQIAKGFVLPVHRKLFQVAKTPKEALDYIYKAPVVTYDLNEKWEVYP